MGSEAKCYIHGAASVCPCDPVYATEAEAKDAEIARLRDALEWYADTIRRERPWGGSGAGLQHGCARQIANDGGERAREALGRELLYRFSGGRDA